MDLQAIADIVEFASLVLEELHRGNEATSNEDVALQRLSYSKIESYSDVLSHIIGITMNVDLKSLLTTLSSYASRFLNDNDITSQLSNQPERIAPTALSTAPSSSSGGRPAYLLPIDYINTLKKAGMSKAAIARLLNISRTTLYKHKHFIYEHEEVDDNELKEIIKHLKEENPSCGEKYVTGYLQSMGKKATQLNIRLTLRILDPVGTCFQKRLTTKRIPYSNAGRDSVWHIDGNEKLQAFRLYVHGCVDGYSRKLLYAVVTTNKSSTTVLHIFKNCVAEFGFPLKVRSDKGLETRKVAKFMLKNRGPQSNSYITGRSVHNQRIERMWGEINKITLRFKFLLHNLVSQGQVDVDNELHLQAVAFVYIPRIQRSLDEFQRTWNCHSLRTVKGDIRTPDALYATSIRPTVLLEDSAPLDLSDTSDSEDENDNIDDLSFQNFARTIVPDPLIEDGCNGETSLIRLLNSL